MNRPRIDSVKLCALCGTLNFHENVECWTCRWRGDFSRDAQTIALAWKRLETQYEEVRMEHLVARRTASIGDFGAPRPASLPQKALARVTAWWRGFQTRRELRQAQREAYLRSQTPSP